MGIPSCEYPIYAPLFIIKCGISHLHSNLKSTHNMWNMFVSTSALLPCFYHTSTWMSLHPILLFRLFRLFHFPNYTAVYVCSYVETSIYTRCVCICLSVCWLFVRSLYRNWNDFVSPCFPIFFPVVFGSFWIVVGNINGKQPHRCDLTSLCSALVRYGLF